MNYPVYSLGEIANITMGQSPPGDTYNTQQIGLPFFQGKAEFGAESPTPVKWCSKPTRTAEAGDILLSVRAPVGPTNIASETCCIGRGLAAIRAKDNIALTRYLLYFFRKFESQIANKGVGSTFAAINKNDIEQLKIPIPPLAEQERIVRLLDEAEGLRKLRNQASTRLEEFIPALFYEMFGDPASTSQKWQQKNIGELLLNSPNYGTMIPVKLDSGDWLNLRVANIQNGSLDLSDSKYVNLPKEFIERHTVKDGDLLLARAIGSREHLGKCVVVYPGQNKWAFDSHLMRVRPDHEKILSLYLHAFLTSPSGREIFLKNTRQSAVQFNINTKEFVSIQIPVPPLYLQHEFVIRVQEAREIQSRQAQSAERIESLYQSMLSRAFAGEL